MTLDEWLQDLAPVTVEVRGRKPFTLQVDLAGLSLTRYDAVQATVKAAKGPAETVPALAAALAEVVQAWDLAEPPTAANLARLGEVALYRAWDKVTDFLLPPDLMIPPTAPTLMP